MKIRVIKQIFYKEDTYGIEKCILDDDTVIDFEEIESNAEKMIGIYSVDEEHYARKFIKELYKEDKWIK